MSDDFPQALDTLTIQDIERWIARIARERGEDYLLEQYLPYIFPSYPHLLIHWYWKQNYETWHNTFNPIILLEQFGDNFECHQNFKSFLDKYYVYVPKSDWSLILTRLSEINTKLSTLVAAYLRNKFLIKLW